jgi:hypothetical protein
LKSLLYASVSTLAADEEHAEIGRIVQVARERNARLGVTGTLIYNRARFAQVLEGPAEAVDEIMARILRDQRHEKVTVVDVLETTRRCFANWSLSYSGASHYVDKHIAPLLDGPDPECARQLRNLMQALADGA